MTWVITFKRSRLFATFSILAGTFAGLACGEIGLRLFEVVPRLDRLQFHDPARPQGTGSKVDCYPAARGVELPIDLRTEAGRAAFLRAFPGTLASHPVFGIWNLPGLEEFAGPVPAARAVELLAGEVPLCNLQEEDESSQRHVVTPPGYRDTIGLLGDSFVYGQGIRISDTLTVRLASLLGARVRSYAFSGANIKEVGQQFVTALQERKYLHTSKLLYFFVLNDPYPTPELYARLDFLDDLMNVRLRSIEEHGRFLKYVTEHSRVARLVLFEYSRFLVSRGTIDWYRELNDPVTNPRLLQTFEELARMSREARRQGVDFIVMLYPLMLDMKNYPLAASHAILRDLAAARGIEFHDLLPAFQARAGERTLTVHPVDYHPNAYAQSIAAEDAAAYLKRRTHH